MTPKVRPEGDARRPQRERDLRSGGPEGHPASTARETQGVRVSVAYVAPGVEDRVDLALPHGSVVADAVAQSGVVPRLRLDAATLAFAIHGQRAAPDTPLADGDRVEVLRPLLADPKAARRRRAHTHPLPRTPRHKVRRGGADA